jgi:hypothetical protein
MFSKNLLASLRSGGIVLMVGTGVYTLSSLINPATQPPQIPALQPDEIRFTRYFVAAESYESVGVFDVDNNGHPDLVSGDFWYENAGEQKGIFRQRHLIGNQKRFDQYYDDFGSIPMDINQDGYLDVVTGGWFGQSIRWLENPGAGKDKPWPIHEIAKVGNVEAVRSWDVDGDGMQDIVPNTPRNPLKYFQWQKDGTFKENTIWPIHDHGLGFGDINGDGRGDFVVTKGWIENKGNQQWQLHEDFDLGTASVPIFVVDVNGDQLMDMVVGQGHSYGLHWYEQTRVEGKISWEKHAIDEQNSQYHTMEWADIDGDGKPDLVTGKRYRAHNGKDPGSEDSVGLYYFTWSGTGFVKHIIADGPAGVGKGTGLFFRLADLRKTGRLDLIVAGKDGLTVFFNEGK